MKWLIGTLLLANLALLMWGMWYHEPLVALRTPQAPADVAADKMKLLAEPGARLVVRRPDPKQLRASDASGAAGCYQLGPFPTLEKARMAGARLGTWGVNYERVAEFETLGPAYRVVVPPLPSKEAAERRRREIAALGFTDNAPIQGEAGMENAISFGIFSVEQNARVRAQQLAAKGIQTIIQPIPNVHPIYWLAIAAVSSDGQLAGVPLDRFSSEDWGTPEVGLRSIPCHTDAAAGR